MYNRLENLIVGRHDKFENIGDFHVEYNYSEHKMILQLNGVLITENDFTDNQEVRRILHGIYGLYQIDNEPTKGRLYDLMIGMERLLVKLEEDMLWQR